MNTNIHLSMNPLDDYQRTIFSDTPYNTISSLNQWSVTISETSYTTDLVHNIKDIPILGKNVFENPHIIDKTGGYHEKKKGKMNNRVLHCQEYRFPNIKVRSAHIVDKINNVDGILTERVEKPSSSAVVDNNKTLIGFVNDDTITVNTVENVDIKCGNSGNASSLINKILVTKDDVDKKTTFNTSNIIFDTGCNVIWSEGTGFVYMTGIWKIYQKVMEGLVTMDRNSIYGSEDSKQLCLDEWNIISTNVFGRRCPSYSHSDHSSNNKSLGPKGEKSNHPDRKNEEPIQTNNIINPFDFNWERVNHYIREQLLEYYKSYLIRVRNISPSVLQSMEIFDLAQKVRGGYTHIQGTWLPIQLARRLCLMFAYPIRYLLIPLFGSTFPKDCEGWYKFYEANNKQMKAFIIPFDNNPRDNPNHKTALVVANTFNNNHHLTKNAHSSNSDPKFLNSRTDNPEGYTDIIESQSDQQQPIIPSGISKRYGLPGQSKVVSRENNYFQTTKKPFNIRKRYHQNIQVSEKNNLATHESQGQSEYRHALNNDKNVIHTKNDPNQLVFNHVIDSTGYTGPFSVGESSLIQPSNTPSGLINSSYPTNIPDIRFSSPNQTFNYIDMGAQNMNNTLLPVNNLPVLYNDIPNQPILYYTPNDPRISDGRAIIIAPTQPNIYNGINHYPPKLAYRYRNAVGTYLPPIISPNNTPIANNNNNIPNHTLLSPYSSMIVPNISTNSNIWPDTPSLSTQTLEHRAYTPNTSGNEMHNPNAIIRPQNPESRR